MSAGSFRAMISLGSQGCAAMDGYWLFRKDGPAWRGRELPFMWERSGKARSCTIGSVISQSRAYESGLEINMGGAAVGVCCSPPGQKK